MQMPNWTVEEMTLLRKLITEDGLSAGQTAKIMKRTRSAVVGKCRRIDVKLAPPVPPKPKPARAPKMTATVKPHFQVRQMIGEPVSTPPKPEKITTPTATLIELNRHRCRWPIGDPQEPGFGFCGRSSQGHRYCPTHSEVATRGTPSADDLRALARLVTR